MSEPIKVLFFVDRMLRGGIQSLVIDWVSRFDKNKIQVDFLLLDDGKKYELEDTLKELGCKIYKLDGVWIRKPSDFIKQAKSLDEFFKVHHDYKVVHLHSSSKNYLVLKYAQKYDIPVRIAHSHNIDFQTKNILKKIYGNFLKPKLIKYSTDFFSCSKLAGRWLFGDDIVSTDKFKIIHNAVDFQKFQFNKSTREQKRKELNILNDQLVIANVGRFSKQKNHEFLIDIFYEIQKQKSNSVLVLVGTGELEEIIKDKVKELGIDKKVIFTGFRNDVSELYQAFDVFLMPSLHEGLPVVGVEAQASGLPCFMSKDVITDEVKIADNLTFIPLEKKPKEWADLILSSDLQRKNNYNCFKKSEYFIEDTTKKLSDFYLK